MTAMLEGIRQDTLALSVACALAVANETAAAQGVDLTKSLITITEETPPPERSWRIHYGPRDFRNRRGGDFIVVVNDRDGEVLRTLRGQ